MLHPLMVDGSPHWEARFPQAVWPAYEEFTIFLGLVWDHLGLPALTPAQHEVAHWLQYGVDTSEMVGLVGRKRASGIRKLKDELMYHRRESILRAFRFLGMKILHERIEMRAGQKLRRDAKRAFDEPTPLPSPVPTPTP